jgi:hypothetical protein
MGGRRSGVRVRIIPVGQRWLAMLVVALAACGEISRPPESQPSVREPGEAESSELVFTEPDGSTFAITATDAECGPSGYDPDVQVVRIRDVDQKHNFLVEVVPSDVAGGKRFDLPVHAGHSETGPATTTA